MLKRTATHLVEGHNYRTFTFTAEGKGQTQIGMEYQPPGTQKATMKFLMAVQVR